MNYAKSLETAEAGELVLMSVRVSYGFHTGETFYLPVQVDRTTKTQIVIGKKRFKRNTGGEIGNITRSGEIVANGEPRRWHRNETATDETEEYKAFKNKLELERTIRDKAERLGLLGKNSPYTTEQLEEIHGHLCAIDDILADDNDDED